MTYLNKSSILFILLSFVGIVYFLGIHLVTLIAFLLCSFIFFISRKKKRLNIIEEKSNGLVFAPISGVIKSIQEIDGQTHIHIKREFFNEWGVYMPSCGKIEEIVEYRGRRRWFFFNRRQYRDFSRVVIRIKSKLGKYDLQLINSKMSYFDCWIDAGDYGFGAARLGFIKGSFHAIMILPKEFSVVMRESEVLKSGQSIIAANTAVHS